MTEKKTLRFHRTGHFWQDCGLLGLWSTVRETVHPEDGLSYDLDDDGLTLEGPQEAIHRGIEKACDLLVSRYYDVSTKKQIDSKEAYNFYLDRENESFVAFPKKKTYGIANMVYDQPSKASKGQIPWNGKAGILPEEYSYLQSKLEEFLVRNKLKATGKNLLIDGPNAIRPKMEFDLSWEGKKAKKACALCGRPTSKAVGVKSTVFPLMGGNSAGLSFNPLGGNSDKVCWKCALLGLFVPAVGLYRSAGSMLFAYFPFGPSLSRLSELFPVLEGLKENDPNGCYNFQIHLGSYFGRESEITLAFLHHLYLSLRSSKGGDSPLELEELLGLVSRDGDLGFYVLAANLSSDPKAVKSLWPFMDTGWSFRLFDALERQGLELKKALDLMIDWKAKKDKTLVRDRICRSILNGRSILEDSERLIYHLHGEKDRGYIDPLVKFVLFYEKNGRRTKGMKNEDREAAVRLGKRIGAIVGSNDREKGERRGRSDLYSLRRTRSIVPFMEQLNRLQFRMSGGLVIPPDIYEGAMTEANFSEFKQYCMICALNSYFAALGSKAEKTAQEVL